MQDIDLTNIVESLDKFNKKLDKVINLNTRIAKALHLLPVSEKEERDIQIAQRESIRIQAKVNNDLNAMENKPSEPITGLSLEDIVNTFKSNIDVYSDIIDTDYLGG